MPIGQIFGFYSAAELTKILDSILRKDRFIFLASHNHVGLLFINEKNNIELFDINHDQDDVIYENLDSVAKYFSTRLSKRLILMPYCHYVCMHLRPMHLIMIFHQFMKLHNFVKMAVIAYSPENTWLSGRHFFTKFNK